MLKKNIKGDDVSSDKMMVNGNDIANMVHLGSFALQSAGRKENDIGKSESNSMLSIPFRFELA